ncbi:MAG: hypothetical protein Q4P06_07945 [Actinomycetaceae bacterium]|nr:hypothetical protein [Actinomycetaceae bacterium]
MINGSNWRQALADISGAASYLVIGLALWAGVLMQVRPSLQRYLDLSTAQAWVLVSVIATSSTWVLWFLAAQMGPVAQRSSELLFQCSYRQRNRRLALTWLFLTAVALLIVFTTLLILNTSHRGAQLVGAAPLSIAVGCLLLALAQRYNYEQACRAAITGWGLAIVVLMAVNTWWHLWWFLNIIAGTAIVAAVVLVSGFMRAGLRAEVQAVPRWSLLRAAAFQDAVTGVTQLFDSTSAQVYRDLHGKSQRMRLGRRPGLLMRTWLRLAASSLPAAVVATLVAMFVARTTTVSAGIWVALVAALVLAQLHSSTWGDWFSSPALQRLVAARWHTHVGVFLVVLFFPVLVASVAIGAVLAAAGPWVYHPIWAHALAGLAPIIVLLTASEPEPAGSGFGEFIVTPEGMVVPTSLLQNLGATIIVPLALVTLATAWSPLVACVITALVAGWEARKLASSERGRVRPLGKI